METGELAQMLSDIHDGLVAEWRTKGPAAVWDRLESCEQHTLISLIMAHIGADAT